MLGENSSHYPTLQNIVNQLEFCEYQTEDGLHELKMNAAFIALKERAAAELAEQNGHIAQLRVSIADYLDREVCSNVITASRLADGVLKIVRQHATI
jgi:hypothetical protein